MGPDAMILAFWMLSFKPAVSCSSFIFIKRLFSFSSLSAIRVVSSAYLRLLIYLPDILIPACVSFSLAFLMRYSSYKLNKQGNNLQPWHTPFPILNLSIVPCLVLTVASWPFYRFLRSQVRCFGILIYWRIFLFSVIQIARGFCIVSEAEDVFWNSLVPSIIQWILAFWSLIPLPFLNPAYTSESSHFTYIWNLAWRS